MALDVEHVGVREFHDKVTHYLAADKPVAVHRHGKLIGYYIPVKVKDPERLDEKFKELDDALDRAAASAGLTRDELIDALDPTKPPRWT